ncbi:MAG: DUF3995 domain-containing protein [Geodermatophilaceae bacterium]
MPQSSGQVSALSLHSAGRWAGYAACVCAFLFAATSFYWGTGGTLGLDLVGREAVELVASGNVGILIALWLVGLLKVASGLLALALVQPWGAHLFRPWMLLLAGWGGATLLVLYGAAQIGLQLLVLTGVIEAPADMDWRGFYGHLYVWDPWFVVWGVLLGGAALHYTRRQRRVS